jgi:hypothetical protein
LEIIKNPSRDFWWEVAVSCEHATFLQSPLWTELACRSYDNLRDATIGAILESGTRVILPMVEAPAARGAMRALESTWNWSPGGVIADGPVEAEEIRDLYDSLQSWRLGEGVFTGNPHSSLPDPPVRKGWKVQEDFSQILPLAGDLDSIVGGFERRHRKALRGAVRAGVTVREARGVEDYQAHYQAYLASYERWKARWAAALPWRLFETCHAMSVEYPDHISLWLAEVDGRFASGAILFYWNRFVVAWHASAHEELFKYSPNNVLHTEIMRDALERGMSCYDFNPSGGQEGVVTFKAGFGAEKRFFKRATYSSPALSLTRALGRVVSR